MLYSASIQRNSWHILIAIVSLRIEADLNGIGILAVLSVQRIASLREEI
jgi:hypothetical protein